jgi:6-phosphofructokinase 1
MRQIAVLTSGGDAPGMNATVRAVVRMGVSRGWVVHGVRSGFAGLIEGNFVPLGLRDVGGIIAQGGTFLGTRRCEALKTDTGQATALQQLQTRDIDALIVIGGNGSQRGAAALSRGGAKIIGLASTIDNDLADFDVTLGTTTALEVALEAIDRLRVTASSLQRVFLVEVMGRNCGYLALMAGIAGGAEAIVIPERPTDPELLAEEIRAAYRRGKSHAIVVVAEGSALNAEQLARYFTEHAKRLEFELRITKLGHTQRGAAPGLVDRMMGTRLGIAAIEHFEAGHHGSVLGILNGQITSVGYPALKTNNRPLDAHLLEVAHILAR